MAETYRVATRGLKQGFTEEQVSGMLITLFNRTKEEIRPMTSPRGVIVKKGIDLQTAKKYKEAIERCGCICAIEPDSQNHISTSVSNASQQDGNARHHIETPHKHSEVISPGNPFPGKSATPIQQPQDLKQPAIPVSGTAALAKNENELALVDWPSAQKPEQETKVVQSAISVSPAPSTWSSTAAQNVEEDEDNDEELGKIASGQRLLNISVALSYVFYSMKGTNLSLPLSFFFTLIVVAMTLIGLLRLTKGLNYSQFPRILLIFCGFFPLANLVVLFITNRQASRRLKEAGFRVGLFGAGDAIPPSHDYRNILIGAFVLTLPVYMLVNYGHAKTGPIAPPPSVNNDDAKFEQIETDYYMGRTKEARQALLDMAQAGNTTAMQHLGILYLNGRGSNRENFIDSDPASVARDHEQAMFWLRKAADQGDASAQTSLGSIYEIGRGEVQDYAQAARWYSLAAQNNDCVAQAGFAWLYGSGHGVPKDFVKAYTLLDLAQNRFSTNKECFKEKTWLVYGMLGAYPFIREDYIQSDPNNLINKRNVHTGFDAQGDLRFLAELMTPQEIEQGKALAAAWKPGDPL